ncbi:AAA domain-containing protein [Micromonospora sp. NPDC023814]|uniref:DEAD/DEAH box helicase n=1 Tax=Micromonospora sp. NPDC023814 TaxID=3154596 RepID=UPI00340DDBFB
MSGRGAGAGLLASGLRPWQGQVIDLELRTVGSERLPESMRATEEVVLASGQGEVLLGRAGDAGGGPPRAGSAAGVAVRGRTARDEDALGLVLAARRRSVAWAARVDRDRRGVAVRIHLFDRDLLWGEAVRVGVDERTIAYAQRRNRSLASVEDVCRWLRQQLLLPPLPGEAHRRAVVSGRTSDADRYTGLRLHGLAVDADLGQHDGRLLLTRLLIARRPADGRQLTLLRTDLSFTDDTAGARLDAHQLGGLDGVTGGERSYLELWEEYNNQEWARAVRFATDLGTGHYTSCEAVEGGAWRFRLAADPKTRRFVEQVRDARADEPNLELQASERVPALLLGADENAGSARSGPTFSAPLRWIDRDSMQLVLVTRLGHRDDVAPPPSGHLHYAYRGSEVSKQRREHARDRIARGQAEMKGLGLLINGAVPPDTRPLGHEAMSAATRDVFRPGRPTEKQQEAIRIALNTTGIVLIQGPPGTGKTQVITALQQRLAEVDELVCTVGRNTLLTTYQHDALDHVLAKTSVYDLPGVKVDARKRGTVRTAERWRRQLLGRLNEDLAGRPESARRRRLGAVQTLVASYLVAPPPLEATVGLLRQVEQLAEGEVGLAVRDRVATVRGQLELALEAPLVDPVRAGRLRRLVRGLRETPAGFADDGPYGCRRVLDQLGGGELLDAAGADLLARAAAWTGGAAPGFLDDLRALRRRLLNLLAGTGGPVAAPGLNPLVRDALLELSAEAEQRLHDSRDGRDAVLADYVDVFEHDPERVYEAVHAYAPVLAATCQQVDSAQMRELAAEGRLSFDTVIIDEAARANPLDLMIPMACARKRIVLVGDQAQLPHTVERELIDVLRRQLPGDERLEADLGRSLFERLFELLERKADRTVRLDVQYRMHPELGRLVSTVFYGGPDRIQAGRSADELSHSLRPYQGLVGVWRHVPFEAAAEERVRTSWRRPLEAKVVAAELGRLAEQDPTLTFGVIAFHRPQVDQIWAELVLAGLALKDGDDYRPIPELEFNAAGEERLRVGTVDAFQGKEFDVVLLSTTRSNDMPTTPGQRWRRYGHLMLVNRLCVALSRQRRLLIAVGDSEMFLRGAAPDQLEGLTAFRELCHGQFGRHLPV